MGYKTKEWRDSMRVTLDYNNMTEKFLGDKGFTSKQLASYNTAAAAARPVRRSPKKLKA